MAPTRSSRFKTLVSLTTFTFCVCPTLSFCQTSPEPSSSSALITLPTGTLLPLATPTRLPMRAGVPIRAELLYPVYAANHLVLPAGTVIAGNVIGLRPDRPRRVTARLRADFTPFHKPVVQFTSILLPGGSHLPIQTTEATDGAPIYKLLRTPNPKGGIVGQYLQIAAGYLRESIDMVTAPGRLARVEDFLYGQLPYHPEHIAHATAWTIQTISPVTLAPIILAKEASAHVATPQSRLARLLAPSPPIPPPAPDPNSRAVWTLQAYLDDAISSETSRPNQAIHATLAEPVLSPDGSIAIPQGSILSGVITQARPARHFTRPGVLRFSFSELQLPGQEAQTVRTSLTAADTSSKDQLAMNSEGQVKPKAQDKILLPTLLLFLAARPFDQGEHHDDHMAGKDAAASSGLGLISLILGTAARQPNFAAGIGFYSAALSIYPRYFGKGTSVSFPKNTRIVLQTTPTHSQAIKPNAQKQ